MSKKDFEEDDGRTIADMSTLESRSITSVFKDVRKNRQEARENPEIQEDNKTRRAYTLGAIGAGLLIGLIYIAAFAILIIILLLIWRAFR